LLDINREHVNCVDKIVKKLLDEAIYD